jgi:hypothetical protein
LPPVVTIVENRCHQIEPLDHRIANGVDVIGMAHEDEVIAAHMLIDWTSGIGHRGRAGE